MTNTTHMQNCRRIYSIVAAGQAVSLQLANSLRAGVVLLILAALIQVPASASWNDTPAGMDKAFNFLQNRQNGVAILSYLHFGSDYFGHEYIGMLNVVDKSGETVPGDFALVYRFRWSNEDYTDVAFLCNPEGQIYRSEVRRSTAVLNQPFVAANVFIGVLGNLLIESNRRNMTKADLELTHELVNRVDAQGLMDLWLRLQ